MTTTYLDILFDKLFTCAELNEDLRQRARAELREIQRRRDVLVVSSWQERAWVVPYNESTIKSLIWHAERQDHAGFYGIVQGFPKLFPQHHFDASLYSEVVVL